MTRRMFVAAALFATAFAANLVFLQPVAQACEGLDCVTDTVNETQQTTGTDTTVGSLFSTVTDVLLYLVGGVAVIMIVYGGFRYVVSNGDSSRVKAAKDTVLYGAIGLAIAIVAWGLVTFVINRL